MNDYSELMRLLLLFVLFFTPLFAFAESHPEYLGIENPSEYVLTVDDHTFSVPYHVNSHVIAMAIDPELKSLLIGLENTKDSVFVIDLNHEIISAENNDFAILVNGNYVDYEIVSDSDSSTLSFFVPEFTEEVEIVGTRVIPEFPFGAIMGFVLLVSVVVLFPKLKSGLRL